MKILIPSLSLLLLAALAVAQEPAPPASVPTAVAPQATPFPAPPTPPAAPGNDSVKLDFPRTSIFEVLNTYEGLTGKRLIRDSNLAGPELAITAPQPVTRREAIQMIETSLLLNGYTLIPVDEQTSKILGPSRAPRSEGIPLFVDIGSLPFAGDKVISFYKPLKFISPEEAVAVLQGVIQSNPYGVIAQVPNTNALVITDKTPVVGKALALLDLIDVEPAQVVTEFVPLQRASSERIVEILEEMFGKDDASKTNATPNVQAAPPTPDGQVPQGGAPGSGARYENRLLSGKAKFVADKRTNRVLVVTRAENFRYVLDVIAQLDAAGSFEQPYVCFLKYVPVNDVFPVLSDMLSDAETEKQGGNAQPQATPSNPFGNNSSNGGSQSSSDGSSGGLSRPDRLSDEAGQSAPQSVTLGEIRLIADGTSNSIIVFGPPESKLRAQQILELLDQRPKQVYLAVVIGQLRVTNATDYGVNYLIRYQGASGNGLAAALLTPALTPGLNGLPRPQSITGPAALANGLNSLSGLTVFGTFADSVDVFARFLESTNRFRTLSRPVIYTTNNRKATILSGQRVPVPTSTLTTATGGGVNNQGSAVTSNIQYQDVVLKLEVIPLINSDREVNLVIAQTNDNIIGTDTISGNQVPRIATQEITTSVRVPNGATIVLGGLITEEKDKGQEGLPYISRIPVLGSLLGGRTNDRFEKRELVVMIQPVVVDANPEVLKASAYEGDRTRLGRDAQEMTAPLAEQVREPAPWRPTPTPTPRPRKTESPR